MRNDDTENFVEVLVPKSIKFPNIDKVYNKWILGEETEQNKGRWSIGRDLFNLWE